jgi:hypothetical protein
VCHDDKHGLLVHIMVPTGIQIVAGASYVVYNPSFLNTKCCSGGLGLGFYSSCSKIMSNVININERAEVSGLCPR